MYGSRVLVGRMIVQHSCAMFRSYLSRMHASEGLRRVGFSSCAQLAERECRCACVGHTLYR
eukprot:6341294-Prymnesium_polylepis.1